MRHLKGGYTTLDLLGAGAFTAGTAKTIPGAYKAVTSGKPCLINGYTLSTTVVGQQFLVGVLNTAGGIKAFIPTSTSAGSLFGHTITITAADAVTITAV